MAEQGPLASSLYGQLGSWRTCAGGRLRLWLLKRKLRRGRRSRRELPATKMTPMKKTAKKKLAMKRETPKKKLAMKRETPKKKLAKKRAAQEKAAVKTKAVGNKTIGAKTVSALRKRVREKSQSVDTVAFSPEGPGTRSGRQSGDLQGLSSVQGADSESVDELLEEGNAFEADVVTGVEDAGNTDEKEVRTHEVPEDDVPGEYLDKE